MANIVPSHPSDGINAGNKAPCVHIQAIPGEKFTMQLIT